MKDAKEKEIVVWYFQALPLGLSDGCSLHLSYVTLAPRQPTILPAD